MNGKKTFKALGLLLFFGTLLIFGVQYLFVEIFTKIPTVANNGDLRFLITMLPMYAIAYPIIFLIAKKIPVTIEGEKKKMKPSHLVIAFIICYAGTYICNYIGTLVTMIIGILKGGAVGNVLQEITSSIHPLTNLLVVAILAPIMEELLFRKLLLDRTAGYGEGISLLFSGLVFGLFHGNLNQFTYAFVLGIFFSFVYIKTKNIIYPIILHMSINFVGSFLGSLVLEKSRYLEFAAEFTELSSTPALLTEEAMMNLFSSYGGGLVLYLVYALTLMLVALIGTILFFVFLKKYRLSPAPFAIEKGKRFTTAFVNIGMILYVIFFLVSIVMQLFQ